jgi:delta 1-pyrroline-5-carboxylate dehydrogenase
MLISLMGCQVITTAPGGTGGTDVSGTGSRAHGRKLLLLFSRRTSGRQSNKNEKDKMEKMKQVNKILLNGHG